MQKSTITLLISSTFLINIPTYAQNNSETLETISVVSNTAPIQAGASVMLAEDIARKPTRTGNITELLKNNPAVQFSGTSNSSTQAGEIAPDLVSFHGEPYYNNSYLIDGLSNNDLLNPGSSNGGYKSAEDFTQPTSMYIAPGSPESFYINSSLFKNITVYDSNAPAKYARFTGGVIDAEIKDPELSRHSGSISYRTTRDSWTKFQLNEQEQIDFENAFAENNLQPQFTKHIVDLTLNHPLSDKSGLLFSYNRTQSKMPEYHQGLDRWEKERRLAETYLLKGSYQLHDNHTLLGTILYSPHKNIYYNDNVKNGRYVSEGGGWRVNLHSRYHADWGTVKSDLAYQYNLNKIAYDAGANYYNWVGNQLLPKANTTWCTTKNAKTGKCLYKREGGIGELSSHLNTWTLKQDYELNTLNLGNTEHLLSFGWSVDFSRAQSERPEAVRYMQSILHYKNNKNKTIKIAPNYSTLSKNTAIDCVDCIPGEQFQNRMIYYPAFRAKANVNNYNLYLSDEIYWNRFKLIPGVNINYDSFLKNLNIAPRFAFNINVLKDDSFNITGGFNRYFAGNLLTYALRANIPCNREMHRFVDKTGKGQWQMGDCTKNSPSWANAQDLKTPYSNEYNVGFNYSFANQTVVFNWVHRKSQRQFTPFTTEEGKKIMSNDGEGLTNTLTLSLQNNQPYQVGGIVLNYRLGARYQHRKTNYHGNYDESLVADVTNSRYPYYLFEGKRYESASDLPPFNFNQPWEAFLELQTDIPSWYLKWTHSLNYRTGYKSYNRYTVENCALSSQPQACGNHTGGVYDYRLKKYKGKATLDWHLQWTLTIHQQQKLEVSLDVLNVLNSRVATASPNSQYLGGTETQSPTSYELGRQFWLGMAYHW
ncbi:TonB-dependent receptor plug domain-containing protein [Pelistega ratti]|uniref:TonB-dependent receptor plug domain-containing protein n=1 Tax=Pelistega ratti TaxID=2652177 RepID=UPI0013582C2E|nr:TonB-dependent receptor plug domain-containing protein [Pelistega ratti]